MTMSAAGRRSGICRRGQWKSDYHGEDVWEREQRQTGGKLLPPALLRRGAKRCVSVFAAVCGEASADASDATAQLVRGEKRKGMD